MKKKLLFTFGSLALVLAALSGTITSGIGITYTANNVYAQIQAGSIALKDFNSSGLQNLTPIGDLITIEKNAPNTPHVLPKADIKIEGYEQQDAMALVYGIMNLGDNGFCVDLELLGIPDDSNLTVQSIIVYKDNSMSAAFTDLYVTASGTERDMIVVIIAFMVKNPNKDINVEGSVNITLDGAKERPLAMGEDLNKLFKDGSNYNYQDQMVKSITFDKYTSENEYLVEENNVIEGVEGIDIGGGAKYYRVQKDRDADIYILSNDTIYANACQMYTFMNLVGLTKINFNNFDTSHITIMMNMFGGCQSLQSLDVKDWSTEKVTSMYGTFGGCESIQSLDLIGWNTAKVEDMTYMFSGCTILETINGIENFDTKKVTNMDGMFSGCSSLQSLDLSGWNTEKVTNMRQMFENCSSLEYIYVGDGWNLDNVKSNFSTDMFTNCSRLPNYSSSVVDKTNAHTGDGGYLTYKAA